MSYNIKKFALIASIILVLCLLVGVISYCSINSDVANANYYYDEDSTQNISFPFTQQSTLCNFNAINFFYSNLNLGSNLTVNTTDDYYYIVASGISDLYINVNTNSISQTINNIEIPFVYHESIYSSISSYFYYQQGCYCDFLAGNTYYINFAFNYQTLEVLRSDLTLFMLGNSNGLTSLNISYSSIINNSDFMSYDGFVYVSIPFTCTVDYSRFLFVNRLNYLNYYLTVTEVPSFNSFAFFKTTYSAQSDGLSYLDNQMYLTSVFGDNDDTYFASLFDGIDNNNISIYLYVTTSEFTNVSFNISNLTLTTNTIDEKCYTSTTYDISGSYYCNFSIYRYSSLYGNNMLTYYFYKSDGTDVSNLSKIELRFAFANNSYDNYKLGYLAGLSAGKELNRYMYYNSGYSAGYNAGLETANNSSFIGLMSAVVEAPLNAIIGIFDFEILGYNMKSLYLSLLSIALVIFVLKFILGNLGGKGSD